jgi:aspartyl protease family protein
MKFIFDTGASSISMSETEAAFLYKQGTLTEEDFQGKVNFQDAKGEVTQGLVVKLRKVQVGDRILRNIEASIVPNQNAPLLLGQSVLQKFGRLSIDDRNKQLIIE